jgi:two-component system LytT family sensor kinase
MLVFIIATFLGLFFTVQIYLTAASRAEDVSWAQALYWSFGDWYEWALLSPVIFWLCRRFPFERAAWGRSLAALSLAGLALSTIHAILCAAAAVFQGWVSGKPAEFGPALQAILSGRTHYNIAVYAVIVCAWHAWDYHRKLREREAQSVLLAAQLAQAQLQSLRMQLNPHFLFNALNAVSSLMLKDVNAANKMLSRLGDLLRLTLDASNQQEISLRQEIEFLRRYIDVEQIRFGERLSVTMEMEPDTLEARVPNMILQPLVENAIRHAIDPQPGAGKIGLRSERQNGTLILKVTDNGPGLPSSEASEAFEPECRTRVGLSNTRERLQRLYGARQSFAIQDQPGGGVIASISIPFRAASAPA